MTDADPRRARFGRVVLPHLDRLLAFARRRAADAADAEDAVQDACVRAWHALDELRDDAQALPWLYQILRHVLHRAQEKDARRQGLAAMVRLDDADGTQFPSAAPGPWEHLIAAAASEEVEDALCRLPDHYAAAVELRDLDGFSCEAVALALGVPLGTALSRIHRGRRLLAHTIATARAANAADAAQHRAAPYGPASGATGAPCRHPEQETLG